MTDRKRDRKPTSGKGPQPSPNSREAKLQRQADMEQKIGDEDEKMEDVNLQVTTEEAVADLQSKFDRATTDWKTWNATSKSWEVSTLPAASPAWHELSEAKKKATQGFLQMDFGKNKWNLNLKDGWRDIRKLYPIKVDGRKPFGELLSSAMTKDLGTMHGTKYAKAFKCLLTFSSTNPAFIPGAEVSDNGFCIPSLIIAELWIASMCLFGDTTTIVTRSIVFDATTEPTPVTVAWKIRDTEDVVAFTPDTIFCEGNEGAHDLCRSVKNQFLKQGHKKEQWTKLFHDIAASDGQLNQDEAKVLNLAFKMAKTNPKIFNGWNDDQLDETEITSAWAGAYDLFGAAWLGVKWSSTTAPPNSALKPPKYKASTPTPSAPKANEETEQPATPKPSNPYYVVKNAPVAPKHQGKKRSCTNSTYLKVQLGSYWNQQSEKYPEALNNMLLEWVWVIDLLISRDPKNTVVIPWSDRDLTTKPLTKDSIKPASKERVAKVYTDAVHEIQTRPRQAY